MTVVDKAETGSSNQLHSTLPQIDHPNLVKVYDIVDCDDELVIVSEAVDGVSLSHELSLNRWSLGQSIDLVEQLVCGLAEVHRCGLVHGGLNPGSVLVLPESSDAQNWVKIANVGLFPRVNQGPVGVGGQLGVSPYCAPELGGGFQCDGVRADIYAVGVIFLELLVDRSSFQHAHLANEVWMRTCDLGPDIADVLSQLVSDMVHPRPECRPTTDQILDAIDRCRNGSADLGPTPPPGVEMPHVVDVNQPVPVPISEYLQYGANQGTMVEEQQHVSQQLPAVEPDSHGELDGGGLGVKQRVALAVGMLGLGVIGALAAVGLTDTTPSADEVASPSVSEPQTMSTRQELPDQVASPVATTEVTQPTAEVQICCWKAEFEPSQVGIGVDATVSFSSSQCSTVQWIGPKGVEYGSPSWPDPSKGCWKDHEHTFTALAAGEPHLIEVSLVDIDGAVGSDVYTFVPPAEMVNHGGPSVINWDVNAASNSAKVTFRASSCTNSMWIGPGGEALPSVGWPDATVRCWTNHGHEFTGLAPSTTYTISVDLRDIEGRSGFGEFSFTTLD